ncbi:hypothetical protein HDU67_009211 [Dinochytrium kinnereticum]|nr:hypothetical protein HDU67_009211 [Dinochytrium kinnereticum]
MEPEWLTTRLGNVVGLEPHPGSFQNWNGWQGHGNRGKGGGQGSFGQEHQGGDMGDQAAMETGSVGAGAEAGTGTGWGAAGTGWRAGPARAVQRVSGEMGSRMGGATGRGLGGTMSEAPAARSAAGGGIWTGRAPNEGLGGSIKADPGRGKPPAHSNKVRASTCRLYLQGSLDTAPPHTKTLWPSCDVSL